LGGGDFDAEPGSGLAPTSFTGTSAILSGILRSTVEM
jgi:hypothetical protein